MNAESRVGILAIYLLTRHALRVTYTCIFYLLMKFSGLRASAIAQVRAADVPKASDGIHPSSQPRPMSGILVAMTVMNSTFASSGSDDM